MFVMEIEHTEYFSTLKFNDGNGEVEILIQRDLSQISFETENGDCYIDTDRESILKFRDLLDLLISNNK